MIDDYFTEIESLLIASPIVLSFKSSKEVIYQNKTPSQFPLWQED